MKRRILIAVVGIFLSMSPLVAQPIEDNPMIAMQSDYHVTTTKVDFSSASQKVKISIKFFTEDIEGAVGKKTSDANFESSLSTYVGNKFKIKVNGVSKSIRITGVNISDKTTWGYFEVSDIAEVSSIELNITLLNNISGQENIVNFLVNNQRKVGTATASSPVIKESF